MVMFKLKRCVAPSREDYEKQKEKQKEKQNDIQKVPLMLDDLTKEKVHMFGDDIVVCVMN